MPDKENLNIAPRYARGDRVRGATLNTLMDHDARGHRPETGTYEAGGSWTRDIDAPVWMYVTVEVPPFSLLGACADMAYDEPATSSGSQLGLEGTGRGSLLAVYTNGSVTLTANALHQVKPVGQHPVLVQVTGSTPGVGEPCGPMLDSWGVTSDQQGFVCISEPDDDGNIWIVKTPEPKAVIGEVTVAPDPYDTGSETPGVGVMKIMFRAGDDALVDAKDPVTGASPWVQTFYNFSSTSPTVGTKVRALSTLGIGLTVFEAGSGSSVSMVRVIGSGGLESGELAWPSAEGFHSGQLVTFTDGIVANGASCRLRFVDWEEIDDGMVVGEYARVYGPCLAAGNVDDLPLFVVEIGEQTFLAKFGADLDIGQSGDFELYTFLEEPSGITVSAKCVGTTYVADTWAIVTRLRGGLWVASQWECPLDS